MLTDGTDIPKLCSFRRWGMDYFGIVVASGDFLLQIHSCLDERNTTRLSEKAVMQGIDSELLNPVCEFLLLQVIVVTRIIIWW